MEKFISITEIHFSTSAKEWEARGGIVMAQIVSENRAPIFVLAMPAKVKKENFKTVFDQTGYVA